MQINHRSAGLRETVTLTDICGFVRSVRAILLPVTPPAFRDTRHLISANKLLGAAGFWSCKKEEPKQIMLTMHSGIEVLLDRGKSIYVTHMCPTSTEIREPV